MQRFYNLVRTGKIFRYHVVVWMLLGGFFFIAFAFMQNTGFLQYLELHVYDKILFVRPEKAIDNRITIIGETEADIRRNGHPLSDQVLANALKILEAAGARVIGVDKYRDVVIPPGVDDLKKVLQQNSNIVWIYFLGAHIMAPRVLQDKPEQTGFSNIVEDSDDVVRRGQLFLDDTNGISYYSFPLLVALHYLAKENIGADSDENGFLSLNGVSLPPIDRLFGGYRLKRLTGYQIMLDYPGLPNSYNFFTLSDLLDGRVPVNALKDKIILLGGAAPSLDDVRLLPNDGKCYGVEHHAYFISQILNIAIEQKKPLRAWKNGYEYLWLLCWCLIGAYTGYRRPELIWLMAIVVLEFLGLFGICIELMNQGWWAPSITPLFGWGCSFTFSVLFFSSQERSERRQLMQLFASHVSKEVANRLWDDREHFFNDGGVTPDTLTATVLFTDLTNFTAVAEKMEPLLLMEWLNQYMEEMSRCVIDNGGIINKYIGDAIMAVFGAPIKRETEAGIANDARRAVRCAMQFNLRLRGLNKLWQEQGLPTITMRAGIHTGSLVAGSVGGSLRMEYTVLGDTVNTASRLESYGKDNFQESLEQPCRILIGETTYKHVSNLFDLQMVGECQLKGKNQFLKIYQVLTPPPNNPFN